MTQLLVRPALVNLKSPGARARLVQWLPAAVRANASDIEQLQSKHESSPNRDDFRFQISEVELAEMDNHDAPPIFELSDLSNFAAVEEASKMTKDLVDSKVMKLRNKLVDFDSEVLTLVVVFGAWVPALLALGNHAS
jgi:hypothetical protein